MVLSGKKEATSGMPKSGITVSTWTSAPCLRASSMVIFTDFADRRVS
jgi:hypothetical protein